MVLPSDVDLIVIGGGGAGLPAAVTAAESGISRILVLEKRSKLGGNAAMAWGIFASESPVQKEELVDARNEKLFKSFLDWARWKINPEILRAFIWKSGNTIKWLEGKGLNFDLVRYFPNQEPPVWHVPEGHGAHLMDVLAKQCNDLGVQVALDTRCKKLIVNKEGNIKGVVAENAGQEFTIETKAVIIASGGYGGNSDLLKKYCADYDSRMSCFGIPYSGDGLLMSLDIGAASSGPGLLLLEWPHVHGDSASILATISREPYTVFVNKTGKRFIDEEKGLHAFECANAILRQPDKIGYILANEEILLNLQENGAVLGRGNNRAERRREIPGLLDRVQGIASKSNDSILISDSWVEIGSWIGAEPAALQNTIETYNLCCDHGFDNIFFKDPRYLLPLRKPPYYVIKGELVFLQTIGGLKINENMEVLNHKELPIKGLYAAGADTGGWEPDTYNDRFSGTAFGFSVNSGRIAGENAARYISENK